MKALTWHGRRDVRVDTVPDPTIEQPTDAIIRVTSTGLCGSDLHLYEVLGPFIDGGRRPRPRADGHRRGRRLRASTTSRSATGSSCPFNISCGHCFMCEHGPPVASARRRRSATQGMGASALRLHQALRRGAGRPGRAPARAAGPLRADQGPRGPARRPLPVPLRRPAHGVAGRRSTPQIPDGGSVAVIGLGPIGEMCDADRPAPGRRHGHRPGPRARAPRRARSPTAWRRIDVSAVDDVAAAVRELTDGRGPDAVIDAVGMEAHGAPVGKLAHRSPGCCPTPSPAR